MEWFEKYRPILQVVFLRLAEGRPHCDGFGRPAMMSFGIAARKKDPIWHDSLVVNALHNAQENRKLTDGNIILIPLHCDHSSSLRLKVRAIRRSTPFCHTATTVGLREARAIVIVHTMLLLHANQYIWTSRLVVRVYRDCASEWCAGIQVTSWFPSG